MLLALIAGCGAIRGFGGEGAYGVPTPTEPPNPDLRLIDLSYEPASPVADGTELTFTVTANKVPVSPVGVEIIVAENKTLIDPSLYAHLWLHMYDNGVEPDVAANDGVYAGILKLPSQLGPMDSLSVAARVGWWSTATPPEIEGDPLSILAPEE